VSQVLLVNDSIKKEEEEKFTKKMRKIAEKKNK
jgi:hypothetical protein